MRNENELRLGRIKKISGILRVLCLLFMLLCAVSFLQFLTGPLFRHGRWWSFGTLWQTYSGLSFKVYDLTVRDRVLAAIFFALYWVATFVCGLQLFRLLGFYSRGQIFTSESTGQIRRWGLACIAWGIVKFGLLFVPLVIANSRRTQGADLSTIANGLIIVAISWFMEMATEMREENELTV